MGCGAGCINSQSHHADFLVCCWVLGKPAAFDLSITPTLYSSVLLEVSMMAAHVAENRKHTNNDRKCEEMGWVCIPFVVDYWGAAAVMAFSKLTGTTPLTIIYR